MAQDVLDKFLRVGDWKHRAEWLAIEAEWRARQFLIPDKKIGIDEYATVDYTGVKTHKEAIQTFLDASKAALKSKKEKALPPLTKVKGIRATKL
jgi:hypothetical protein